jgi:hypothetical protein
MFILLTDANAGARVCVRGGGGAAVVVADTPNANTPKASGRSSDLATSASTAHLQKEKRRKASSIAPCPCRACECRLAHTPAALGPSLLAG